MRREREREREREEEEEGYVIGSKTEKLYAMKTKPYVSTFIEFHKVPVERASQPLGGGGRWRREVEERRRR